MKALSTASLERVDSEDQLHFVVIYKQGWMPISTCVAFVTFAMWQVIAHQSIWWLILILVGVGYWIADALRGNEARLTVSTSEILATGNLGSSSGEQRCLSSQVDSIGYQLGGEDNPSGLYAKTGLGQVCLLPNISEHLTNEMVDAIYERFPFFGNGDPDPNSLLFGASHDPITLNLPH